jgi:hypothetical protein
MTYAALGVSPAKRRKKGNVRGSARPCRRDAEAPGKTHYGCGAAASAFSVRFPPWQSFYFFSAILHHQ